MQKNLEGFKRTLPDDILATPEVNVSIYAAGEVEQILGIQRWRLQKFLSGKRYKLSPSGEQLGRGGRQGIRRVFRAEDIYRIGIANYLVEDGFAADFVSKVLQFIENNDLVSFGPKGLERPPQIGFLRRGKERECRHLTNDAADPARRHAYYVLDLPAIIDAINSSIREYSKERGK